MLLEISTYLSIFLFTEQRAQVLIVGDTQLYLAAQQASVHAGGPCLGLPRATQVLWFGIAGLRLSEMGRAVEKFVEKEQNQPEMVIIHAGTEDAVIGLSHAEINETMREQFKMIRSLVPESKMVWSELFMRDEMPKGVKTGAAWMNEAAKQFTSSNNKGYCENRSLFTSVPNLFRPDKIYLNERGAFALCERYKRYIKFGDKSNHNVYPSHKIIEDDIDDDLDDDKGAPRGRGTNRGRRPARRASWRGATRGYRGNNFIPNFRGRGTRGNARGARGSRGSAWRGNSSQTR